MKYIILSKLVIATAIILATSGCGTGSNSHIIDPECSAEDFTDTCVEMRESVLQMPQSTVVSTPAVVMPTATVITGDQ